MQGPRCRDRVRLARRRRRVVHCVREGFPQSGVSTDSKPPTLVLRVAAPGSGRLGTRSTDLRLFHLVDEVVQRDEFRPERLRIAGQ